MNFLCSVFVAGGNIVIFSLQPENDLENALENLKKAVEDGNLDIPMPDGSTVKIDPDAFSDLENVAKPDDSNNHFFF